MAASLSGSPLTQIALHSDSHLFHFQERISAIEQGMPQDVRVSICDFCDESPTVDRITRTVYIPSWMLLQSADIPSKFRITGVTDPRFFDYAFLKKFRNWCVTLEGMSSYKFTGHSVQQVLLLSIDSELYEQSKAFLLEHEKAHLSYAQLHGPKRMKLRDGWDGIEGQAAKRLFRNHFSPRRCLIKEERWCDRQAVQELGEAAGGIYLFTVMRELERVQDRNRFGNDRDAYFTYCYENGDRRPEMWGARPSHPTHTQRINDLTLWQFQREHIGDREFGW